MNGNDENEDLECADCPHLESSHEMHATIAKPRPCRIPGCPCPDFHPKELER